MATVARLVGDLQVAEDAVQEACAAAVRQWPAAGIPAHPGSWLIATARHKAVDWQRREAARVGKEAAAVRDHSDRGPRPPATDIGDDQLALIFTCCHPALDLQVRVPLTLRAVCGLSTAEIAAVFLVPEATMAQRLVRAKRKIREAGIGLRVPAGDELPGRLAGVLRATYLMFTEGHRAAAQGGPLAARAILVARELAALLPDEPEVTGLLALLLLIEARRAARLDAAGRLVLLADQDRERWDRAMIDQGAALVERALAARRPGPYQIQAAIAACHSTARTAGATDWTQIAALYDALLRYEPTPVVQANRAVAVSMVEGPGAGLAILDGLTDHPRLAGWPYLHIGRADLLCRLGRYPEAVEAYRTALALRPPLDDQAFLARRIRELGAA